jgi:hypothetical protein
MGNAEFRSIAIKAPVALALAMIVPAPAHAHILSIILPVSAPVAALSLPAGGRCIRFVYDANGNRLSRSASVVPATPAAWGASVYGCSHWG